MAMNRWDIQSFENIFVSPLLCFSVDGIELPWWTSSSPIENVYKNKSGWTKVIWDMLWLCRCIPVWIFLRTHSIPQVESPLVLDQWRQHPPLSLHVHAPPACRQLCLPTYREGKAWNTRQSSPESWPTYLVSSRLIIQLVQGRTDTVKSIPTQFDLSDINRSTVIILLTSIILLVKIILFILHDHEIHISTI